MEKPKEAVEILMISIGVNIALTLLKLVGGIMAGSAGLVADGFHSLTDVIAMTVNYFGMKTSLKPAHDLEAYNNYKKEIIGTFFVSFALFIIGLFILVQSYLKLTSGVVHSPGLGAGVIIIVAFVITCRLYLYSRRVSEQSDSPGLDINTEQIKLNILSTVAVFIGIAGSVFNMNYLDAAAAIFVSLIILYTSLDIIVKFLRELEQARLSRAQVDEIISLAAEASDKAQIMRIKTMIIRKKIWLLLELADSPMTSDELGAIKSRLLSNLSYLDNVIVGVAQRRASGTLKVEIEDFGRELGTAKNYLSMAFAAILVLVACASASGISLVSRQYHVLIPADEAEASGLVSANLGRAPYFYIYRIDKEKGQFIHNRLARDPSEVDRKAARLFKNYSVEAIVTQNIGPHLLEELNAAGILVYHAEPGARIHLQIELFRQESLQQMTRPNVGARFGLKNYKLLSPWYNWQRR